MWPIHQKKKNDGKLTFSSKVPTADFLKSSRFDRDAEKVYETYSMRADVDKRTYANVPGQKILTDSRQKDRNRQTTLKMSSKSKNSRHLSTKKTFDEMEQIQDSNSSRFERELQTFITSARKNYSSPIPPYDCSKRKELNLEHSPSQYILSTKDYGNSRGKHKPQRDLSHENVESYIHKSKSRGKHKSHSAKRLKSQSRSKSRSLSQERRSRVSKTRHKAELDRPTKPIHFSSPCNMQKRSPCTSKTREPRRSIEGQRNQIFSDGAANLSRRSARSRKKFNRSRSRSQSSSVNSEITNDSQDSSVFDNERFRERKERSISVSSTISCKSNELSMKKEKLSNQLQKIIQNRSTTECGKSRDYSDNLQAVSSNNNKFSFFDFDDGEEYIAATPPRLEEIHTKQKVNSVEKPEHISNKISASIDETFKNQVHVSSNHTYQSLPSPAILSKVDSLFDAYSVKSGQNCQPNIRHHEIYRSKASMSKTYSTKHQNINNSIEDTNHTAAIPRSVANVIPGINSLEMTFDHKVAHAISSNSNDNEIPSPLFSPLSNDTGSITLDESNPSVVSNYNQEVFLKKLKHKSHRNLKDNIDPNKNTVCEVITIIDDEKDTLTCTDPRFNKLLKEVSRQKLDRIKKQQNLKRVVVHKWCKDLHKFVVSNKNCSPNQFGFVQPSFGQKELLLIPLETVFNYKYTSEINPCDVFNRVCEESGETAVDSSIDITYDP